MLGSILLCILARIGLPELNHLLNVYLSFDLQGHFRMIISLVMLMTPLMIGLLYGFMILDERDEGLLLYYSVTPLTKAGYLYGRLLVPIGITFLLTFVLLFIQGIVLIPLSKFIPIAFLLALQTPIITMLMGTLASNKVEGLALMKVINLLILVPLFDYLLAHPLVKIVMVFPVYWPVSMMMNLDSNLYWVHFLLGIVVTLVWFVICNYRFQQKME